MMMNPQNTAIRLMKLIRQFSTATKIPTETKLNIDKRDVEHLGSLDHDWWNPNGQLKALHTMNDLRVPLVRDGLISTGAVNESLINKPNVLRGLQILDVGCGGGILTEALGRLKANVVGIDASDKLIAAAIEHLDVDDELKNNVSYLCGSIEEHVAENMLKYDAVVASEVIEHIQDKSSFIRACISTLKPGGSIFITTLNKTQASWLGGIIMAEYVLNLLPKETHDWNQFISPTDLERLLKDSNCHTELLHGMSYEFWRNTWSWTKCTEINYALHAVKDDE